jgi:hypothetical protein
LVDKGDSGFRILEGKRHKQKAARHLKRRKSPSQKGERGGF